MSRIGYLLGEGFRGIFKHGFMSFATVAIILACLIIMGSVTLLSVNIDALIETLENQNEVVAFIDESYSTAEAEAVGPQISALENIAVSEFVTRDEAMAQFMGNYDKELMQGIDSSVFRDRFVIQLTDITRMSETKRALEGIAGVTKVNAHVDYAESFVTIRNIVTAVSFALIIMLAFVSFFIMSNTIKLATFSRKEEIGIMKMVGASNSFIRLPFVIEGLILGILGAVLAFFAEWGVYNLLTEKLVSSLTGEFINVVPFESMMMPILVFYLAVGILVGAFGGVNAIRNYLKV